MFIFDIVLEETRCRHIKGSFKISTPFSLLIGYLVAVYVNSRPVPEQIYRTMASTFLHWVLAVHDIRRYKNPQIY